MIDVIWAYDELSVIVVIFGLLNSCRWYVGMGVSGVLIVCLFEWI